MTQPFAMTGFCRAVFVFLLLFSFLALVPARADVGDTIGEGLLSGDAYRYSTELDRQVYVAGASDLLIAFSRQAGGDVAWHRCIEPMDAVQLEEHFLKWIKAHPEEWPNPAGPLFMRAVREYCASQ
ncbi:MAG: hypothetical protein J4G10_07505 [Alphaproteobacteria bacterium]|nr:hypothetical protein [Alphaproteobacteria bacterium]